MIVTFFILSPILMVSTASMPWVSWPKFVYWPFRCGALAVTTKNWASLLTLMSPPRATPIAPASKGRSLSSVACVPPPLPVPSGSPPCTTKPGTTRWKVSPS